MFGMFGDLVHDYGIIEESQRVLTKTRVSLQLYNKNGEYSLVIKESNMAFLAANVRYTRISEANLKELKDVVDDAIYRVDALRGNQDLPDEV